MTALSVRAHARVRIGRAECQRTTRSANRPCGRSACGRPPWHGAPTRSRPASARPKPRQPPERAFRSRTHHCDLRPHSAGGRDVERSSRSECQFHSRADSLPGARALRASTDSGGDDRADRAPPDRHRDALGFIMTTTPTAMRSAGAVSGDNVIGNLQRVFIRTRHGAFLRHPCAVTGPGCARGG